MLLYVIESKGSSPGRQGFKMAVSQSGLITGSIGGGMMEHKLVELCKSKLLKAPFTPFLKKQIHRDDIPANKSGMICSGEQTIAFFYLSTHDLALIKQIDLVLRKHVKQQLSLSNRGISLEKLALATKYQLLYSEDSWTFKENLCRYPQLHIVGGGHVSLALSRLAREIGFTVTVYDNRSYLNTIAQNSFAETVYIEEYKNIADVIPQGDFSYVVIMSFGYKTDKVILKSLVEGTYCYLGMMGSRAKIDRLYAELEEEGVMPEKLKNVFAPIGLPISSKTPSEIAISILAQMIMLKNSGS